MLIAHPHIGVLGLATYMTFWLWYMHNTVGIFWTEGGTKKAILKEG